MPSGGRRDCAGVPNSGFRPAGVPGPPPAHVAGWASQPPAPPRSGVPSLQLLPTVLRLWGALQPGRAEPALALR